MRTVADAMTEPLVVSVSSTVQAASARMLDAEVEAAVVVASGRAWGLLTADDVAHALLEGHDPARTSVGQIADAHPPLTRAEEPLAAVHQRMRTDKHRLAVVVSRSDEPLGLLDDPEAAP